jgi:hypothetical protein
MTALGRDAYSFINAEAPHSRIFRRCDSPGVIAPRHQWLVVECGASLLFWSVLAIPSGVFALLTGIAAWQNPQLANDAVSPKSSELNRVKFLNPVAGMAFIAAGVWILIRQLRCNSYIDIPHLVQLEWTWWPGIWPAIAIAFLIGVINARRMGPLSGTVVVLLSTGFGVAAGQAAGFHTGAYAGHWGGVAGVFAVAAWVSSTFLPKK